MEFRSILNMVCFCYIVIINLFSQNDSFTMPLFDYNHSSLYLSFIFFLSLCAYACSTSQKSSSENTNAPVARTVEYDTVYVQREAFSTLSETERLKRKYFGTESSDDNIQNTTLDVNPEIVGGPKEELHKVGYPPFLRSKRISGKSVVEFVISPEGQATNIKIIESLHPTLDKSITNALATIKFTPGKIGNKAVPVLVEMPFTFKINHDRGF